MHKIKARLSCTGGQQNSRLYAPPLGGFSFTHCWFNCDINTFQGTARPELAKGLFQAVPTPKSALPPLPFFDPLSHSLFTAFPLPVSSLSYLAQRQRSAPRDFNSLRGPIASSLPCRSASAPDAFNRCALSTSNAMQGLQDDDNFR